MGRKKIDKLFLVGILKFVWFNWRFCHYNVLHVMLHLICRGSSVVEQKPEELRVGGSIPSLGTKKEFFVQTFTRPVGSM